MPIAADETRINASQLSQSLASCTATFGIAQALITEAVPWRMHKATCSQIGRQLISFSALSNQGSAADMGTPVTTIERVGRTIGGQGASTKEKSQ